jgi:hypothetical protein
VAVVLLAPAMVFFRIRISRAHLPAVVRTAVLLVELVFGVLLIPVFVVGMVASAVPEFLNGVGTSSALLLSNCAAILFLLLLGARLSALWSWLCIRAAGPAAGSAPIAGKQCPRRPEVQDNVASLTRPAVARVERGSADVPT